MHGIALWFDCQFRRPHQEELDNTTVTLSTSPWSDPTHWKQTVIITAASIPNDLPPSENEGNLQSILYISKFEKSLKLLTFANNSQNFLQI